MKTDIAFGALLLLSGILPCQAEAQETFNPQDEYLKNLKNYKFKNTQGMMDLHPNRIPWIPEHRQDPDTWEAPTDEEIAKLREMGINFPDLDFITNKEDKNLAEGQKRQRTHTVEHIIYALPGDAVSLYPYYGLEEYKEPNGDNFLPTMDYLETFSHWYDYNTGGRVTHTSGGKVYDLLDFPCDRKYIQITDNYGFYGGVYMSPGRDNINSGKNYQVSTPDEYIAAVNEINKDGGKGYIELTADLDFNGKNAAEVPMLGTLTTPFFGTINGNGHIVKNLKIERDAHCVGLISVAGSGAAIYNITLQDCHISGKTQVGLAGYLTGGQLTVSNIRIDDKCSITGTNPDTGDHFVGAVLGRCDNEGADNRLTIENVYVCGQVGNSTMSGHKNTALCGWLATNGSAGNSVFKNIVVNATVSDTENLKAARYIRRFTHEQYAPTYYTDSSTGTVEERHSNYSILYTNCYGNLDNEDPGWKTFSDLPDMSGWFDTVDVQPYNFGGQLLQNASHRPWDKENCDPENQNRRKAGTSAVFYFPETLSDEWDEEKEYVIAADFSQTFYPDARHINVSEMTVNEPLIAFRHIFRIRDARRQTAQLLDNNDDYIRRRQHKVTARGNAKFQIRLDSPLPTGWGTTGGVTNYYFGDKSSGYDRLRQYGIRVLDGKTHTLLPGTQNFYLGADIRMRRARKSASMEYSEYDNQFRYHTMLRRDNPPEKGRYIVQIIAKDNSGNTLTVNGEEIVLMQYDINFVASSSASLVTEKELYDTDPNNKNNNRYRHARDEYLKEKYGDTQFKIDFDNYFKLNTLTDEALKKKMISYSVSKFGYGDVNEQWYKDEQKDNIPVYDHQSTHHLTTPSKMHHSFYKWPVAWESSTYGFGYNYRYNYNMYMLATHTTNVPFHASADHTTQNIDGEEGLYDRLYYKTKRMREANPDLNIRQQQGYFYYVNAASDPGVSARLNVDLTCPGQRVIVSAWVAEMTKGSAGDVFEAANLSFNFVAVMKDTKERVVLHNFVTGYIPDDKLGQWCNVYYSFIPRMSEFYNDNKTFEYVDHFELELAHNGESSVGADYAVDDIRAYVVPASALAEHEGFACDDTPIDLRIETSFETLIEKLGKAEGFGDTDEELDLYYVLADKEKFEETMSIKDGMIGKISFSNNFSKIPSYIDEEGRRIENVEINKAYGVTADNGERTVVFETKVPEGKLKIGKEYYVAFRSENSEANPSGGVLPEDYDADSFFDLNAECAYYCVFTLDPSLQIKIDGIIQPEFDNISVCENQMPVIQVNVWSTDKEPVEVQKNAYFDWFDGTINDFESYRFKDYPTSKEIIEEGEASDDDLTLKEAIKTFRLRYSDAEDVVGIKAETEQASDGSQLTQWMLDIIDIASTPEPSGRRRLWLHQSSFVMPPVDLPENVNTAKAKAVAIPIPDLYPNGNYTKICASPTEIGVKIANHTPILRHGLSGITYPADLYDVPLRVGMSQLCKDNISSLLFSKKTLDMPIRTVNSSDGKERKFSRVTEKTLFEGREETKTGCLLLAQTNDPEYHNLGTVNGDNQETGYLLWVGEIRELNASMTPSGNRNYFLADFDKDFKFKEGYYYRMRFSFKESADEESESDEVICDGHDIFTIKVVPEFVKWTGDKNLSWDNDANWSRISSNDLMAEENAASYAHLLTDGKITGEPVNTHSRAFAPLNFSKVIVCPPTVVASESGDVVTIENENPWLYTPTTDEVEVADDYGSSQKPEWTANPVAKTADLIGGDTERIGTPTSLIEYDMVAKTAGSADNAEIRCTPWRANRCDEIHFMSGATIMNQQALNYDKAWVDIEVDHSRWYLLSTPLKDIYAGDFFLPSDNARQSTELFKEITFEEGLHNRFAPAVYQRGWDKNEAKVYEIGNDDTRNVAVKTFWSHVYNDVAEKYGEGNAFSIKTDVAMLDDTPDKVLFRLPKADEKYFYYSQAGEKGTHYNEIDKENSYRLNNTDGTLTSSLANQGNYFLVGNPFMTYMDIRKFIMDEENAKILEPKYWVITEKGQIAVSLTEEDTFAAVPYPADDLVTDPSAVAPMQGFFVKTKNEVSSITLRYDETMMRRYEVSGNVLTSPTRSGNQSATLKVTALCGERPASSAIILAGEEDAETSVEAIDNRDLDIPATVYSIAHGKAMSINFSEDLEATEIGLIADENTCTTLHFEGGENFRSLFLLDTEDGGMTPLDAPVEVDVKGAVAGRFFITAGLPESTAAETLHWRKDGSHLTVTDLSLNGDLEVSVFDVAGQMIESTKSPDSTITLTLPTGINIVKMKNRHSEKTIKIIV